MDFEEASAIGREGERHVSAALERFSHAYSFEYVDDILIETRGITTQLDHVLVDRFGILIIETKVRRGALLRGTSTDRRWTACYPGGLRKTFQNPLEQSRRHEDLLRKALSERGFSVDPDYVNSAVVFVDTVIDSLELKSPDRARVVDVDDIEDLFRSRHDSASNKGDWTPSTVAGAIHALNAADRSSDPATTAAHARRARREQPVAPPERTVGSLTSSRALSPAAYGPLPPIPVSRRSSTTAGPLSALALFALLVIGACAVVVVGTSLVPRTFTWAPIADETPQETDQVPDPPQVPQTPPSEEPQTTTPDLSDAKAALRDVFPSVYPLVRNLDDPTVRQVDGRFEYTWDYIEKTSPRSLRVGKVTVALDAGGAVVAIDLK